LYYTFHSAPLWRTVLHPLQQQATGNQLPSKTVGYDANGDIASVTDPVGNVASFTYNAAGQVLTQTTPLGMTSYTYDYAGNLTSKTDPTGRKITYSYDGNNLTTETWYNADGTLANTKSYTYDTDGNMLSASDNSGTCSFTYQGGQLATQTDPNRCSWRCD
jgi:YD repeat-containing protein